MDDGPVAEFFTLEERILKAIVNEVVEMRFEKEENHALEVGRILGEPFLSIGTMKEIEEVGGHELGESLDVRG